jgi:polyvinyl alcohol dehydrogenase (cytochrome)
VLRSPAVRLALVVSVLLGIAAAPGAAAATTSDWPAYLFGVDHRSHQPADATITPENAAGLVRIWQWMPAFVSGAPARRQIFASPTVVGGVIYIGANTGDFYALDEATGTVIWRRSLGFQPSLTCKARGFTSTATVAPDPGTGAPTVYVAAGDGNLYALDAKTGAVAWKALVVAPGTNANEGYNWASPTVAGGHVFMGVSSQCDKPLIRGGVKVYDQDTGALIGTYWAVPSGSVGASVWSSVAATPDGSNAFVTTGNADQTSGAVQGDSFSIVRLDALGNKQDIWTIPGLAGTDRDFGASPTLFTATVSGVPTQLVGACNKNGRFYALRANNLAAGPVWVRRIGGSMCFPAAVSDGSNLYVSGDTTSIAGVSYRGSVRKVDPATGAPIWETPLNGHIVGTPTLNAAGVIAAPVYDSSTSATKGVYLLDARTGAVIRTLPSGGKSVWAQPVFADGHLLVGTIGDGLYAYGLPGS